jgi:hypothetical protein
LLTAFFFVPPFPTADDAEETSSTKSNVNLEATATVGADEPEFEDGVVDSPQAKLCG